jgi:pimeloyl-ACP methyl ester carboxylesterase
MAVEASRYERRIACGERPRVGPAARTVEGLGVLEYDSLFGARGGGRAVVFVPPGHDAKRASSLLVGTHPWNGSVWTYAAYAELLHEAQARDVVLLMPSGLGNSLYTADAEHEVLRAIDALSDAVAIDPRRISIWGASMGGAGATTIAFHHPDRFASATSFFGDSKYDLTTYVRAILPSEQAAHRVNALDIVENARSLPLWLIHGEDDRTSPIRQSEILAAAMRQRGYGVRFDRMAGFGHAGALVARFVSEVVEVASPARVPDVSRVTYRSVREEDDAAYGVRIVRERPEADAFVDVERKEDAVHVRVAEGVSEIVLTPGALGTPVDRPPAIVIDDANVHARVRWESKH